MSLLVCRSSRVARPLRVVTRIQNVTRQTRARSSSPLTKDQVRELLSNPTWSVNTLNEEPRDGESTKVTQEQLHRLLRQSALPIPPPEKELAMIQTLESQLRFVHAIRRVDTERVVPLTAIRDETLQTEEENEINLDTPEIKDLLSRETSTGFAGRIVKRERDSTPRHADHVDPLKLAPKTEGRYVVVNTKKS